MKKERSSNPRPTKRTRAESPSIATVDSLREQTLEQLGSSSIAPSEYGGRQQVHEQGQRFPGLVADMQAAFEGREDNLWGNLMNTTANSHLQIDGTLRAILGAQLATAAEATRTRIVLEGISDSLAVLAGGALGIMSTNPRTAALDWDAVMNFGRGEPLDADANTEALMDTAPAEEKSDGDDTESEEDQEKALDVGKPAAEGSSSGTGAASGPPS